MKKYFIEKPTEAYLLFAFGIIMVSYPIFTTMQYIVRYFPELHFGGLYLLIFVSSIGSFIFSSVFAIYIGKSGRMTADRSSRYLSRFIACSLVLSSIFMMYLGFGAINWNYIFDISESGNLSKVPSFLYILLMSTIGSGALGYSLWWRRIPGNGSEIAQWRSRFHS